MALAGAVLAWSSHDPQDCLEEFMHGERRFYPEIMLQDPLILCWGDVDALVMEAVKDREMPRRGYAILYLGEYAGEPAADLLRAIISDDSEDLQARGTALTALSSIHLDEAVRLADPYFLYSGSLGITARNLVMDAKRESERLEGRSGPGALVTAGLIRTRRAFHRRADRRSRWEAWLDSL